MPAAQAVRSIPWKRILAIAQIVLQRLGDDIPAKDRRRLRSLLSKSKGDPRRLSREERADVVRIVRQVDITKLGRDLAAAGAATRLLRR